VLDFPDPLGPSIATTIPAIPEPYCLHIIVNTW